MEIFDNLFTYDFSISISKTTKRIEIVFGLAMSYIKNLKFIRRLIVSLYCAALSNNIWFIKTYIKNENLKVVTFLLSTQVSKKCRKRHSKIFQRSCHSKRIRAERGHVWRLVFMSQVRTWSVQFHPTRSVVAPLASLSYNFQIIIRY